MKEFTIKQHEGFRLIGKKTECLKPKGLYTIELTNECLNNKGEVTDRSTYNFFLTEQEIQLLSQNLLND